MAILFLLILFISEPIEKDVISTTKGKFYIWNVGQGQWTTLVENAACWHFDIGGEKAPWKRILKLCHGKFNYVFISHNDWDHIRFLHLFMKKVLNICVHQSPYSLEGEKEKIKDLYQGVPVCPNLEAGPILIYQNKEEESIKKLQRNKRKHDEVKNKNTKSLVWILKNSEILIPGDSPVKEEKKWERTAYLFPIKGLILGHHGSATSTSQSLLDHLPKLKWAVASARKGKYGHPHPLVQQRLARKKIPLLRTEDWGDIQIDLSFPK